MRAFALGVVVALCGCGEAPADDNASATTNQIERLSAPREKEGDPQVSARPMPLSVADVEQEGLSGPGCSFTGGGKLLLAATAEDALARIEGQLIHLVQSSPMGPSGGFFEDRQISISVGRAEEAAAEGGSSWPARIAVTNRRTRAQVEIAGTWSCAA